jgi:hypothetical protein
MGREVRTVTLVQTGVIDLPSLAASVPHDQGER